MPEMMQRCSKLSGISGGAEHGGVDVALLAELDAHRHVDRDLVRPAADDVRHQTQVGLLVQLDDGDDVGNLEPGRPSTLVDRIGVDATMSADRTRLDVLAQTPRAPRRWRMD